MAGKELQMFAVDNGLQMAYDRVYGFLRGYCTTLWEESGKLVFVVATRFCEEDGWKSLAQKLKSPSTVKNYRIHSIDIRQDRIRVRFKDRMAKDMRLGSFLDWFFPLLEQYGACNGEVCPHCGKTLAGGQWKLVKGIAVCVHDDCGRELHSRIETQRRMKIDRGSYAKGAVGAAIGALAGALIWALISMLGYKAYLVGFLIGLLADRGYKLLGGKENRAKVLVLTLVVILGVVAGNLLGDVLIIISDLRGYDLPVTFAEGWQMLFRSIAGNVDPRRTLIFEIFMGLLFAAVGAVSLLLRAKSECVVPDYAALGQEEQQNQKRKHVQVHQ